MQMLLLAQAAGVFKLGNISLDGSKIHADASKSQAVSYKRLLEIENQLRQEVNELFTMGEAADQGGVSLAEGLDIQDEITIRQEQLVNLAKAKAVLEKRVKERYEAEKTEYEAKLEECEEKARKSERVPRGRSPKPPQDEGPGDKDQYNFTDPDLRIMKNCTNQGVDQHSEIGTPDAVAMDNGYFSAANIAGCQQRGIDPYIATGREPHHKDWRSFFVALPNPPGKDASPKEKMAYQLQTEIGRAIYRLRKCTVEPVIGIIKEILGFRQFSLRGLEAVAGEWCLVCLAFNLKRMYSLYLGKGLISAPAINQKEKIYS